MRRLLIVSAILVVLTACSGNSSEYDRGYADGYKAGIEAAQTESVDARNKVTASVHQPKSETHPYETGTRYVLNTNSKKFHYPDCQSVKEMADRNREDVTDTRENIIDNGYSTCGNCNP